MEAELGQKTVAFSTLVSRTAEESFLSLKELVDKSKSSDLSDSEKKIDLLKYIVKTQQRMLRLNVLAKWCKQVPLIQYCQQLASTLSSHDTCFTQTADSLFFMHEGLQQARAPIYDVPSAIEVLLTGSYERLPKCVENVGMQSSLNENQQKPALRKLEILVRSKLLETVLPKEISEVKVLDGTAILRVNGEFQVVVTLGYRGHLHLWRILHVELLVGEKSGAVKLEELRRFALGDDLERRMAAAVEQQSNPFVTLYSVLHEFCVALVMDTVIRQLCSLRGGRWKDAIKFDLTSDGAQGGSASSLQINQDGEYEASGHRTSGVKIVYWLDSDKNSGGSDVGTFPFIKIEPGSNLQIQCVHSTFVIDPITGKEAEFDLDQSSIDVEKLLLKAIRCNRYTRLLEINKELTEKGQFFPDAGDVHLGCDTYGSVMDPKEKDATAVSAKSDGQEVLCVRAYGSAFFILGINIRNGRCRLQSSRTIIPLIALSEAEDTLNQGTLSASEVFANLRTKSILHMFASIGTFLGLEVYENGFPSVKLPQNILTGASFLLMGFPDCGSSYFLLLQLDKGFKFVFQLLETQPQLSETSKTFDVVRCKKIDVDNMLMLEDEMNLSILDLQKVSGFLPMAGNANQASGFLSELTHKELTSVTLPPSSFSSLIDEVFELEKGNSAPAASHVNPNPLNLQSNGPGLSSPKLEESAQMSHINPAVKLPTHYNGSIYSTANVKGLSQSTSVSSFSAVQGSSANKLPVSKSEQDLASLRSPQPFDGSSFKSMDEDRLRFMNDSFLDVPGRSSRLLSATGTSGANVSASRNSSTRLVGDTGIIESNSLSTAPVCAVTTENENNPKKRKVCDMLNLLPSLRGLPVDGEVSKRRKLLASQPLAYSAVSSNAMRKTERLSYGDLLAEANRGNAPSGVYISALLHVVRHCSLCIKHAMLSSQMEALEIPYFEETGPRSSFLHIWVKIPSLQGDSWPYICLRLGKPGKLCWDVKINDKHFRDLWELQKGNSDTSWGSGVRIANTSDADSHICYDCEGVILSYQSVEADSIKKLVADIRRLYNARMFALGMRKLLGVKTKDKIEESAVSEAKPVTGSKDSTDGPHRLSEQMRKAFRIEAVGLMSLWFSFGSGVLARFVVEWETGKEGCTMHVTPDQLWPHTKFLEDFINGGEVESLLDCIRLTAGPLHALAAATRPARAGQAAITPGVGSVLPASSRQVTQSSSQGLLPGGISSNMGPTTAGAVSNAVAPTTAAAAGPLGNHASAMLAAAGRGGSGIVPSSLLPIDVSVVLRGPYWIRIIYRKHFAVDMRCFAGDQVWLQPATPPKGGPSAGGSLPCPQFRPFIMEHVAQELNGLEPNFVSGQQTAGVSISNPPASSSGSQLATINGNRVNLSGSPALSRPGGQISALNRAGNSLSAPPNMASATSLALRRSSVGAVPAHVRGELNTAIIGLGDDGGYGGGWVPLVALKKVLRGILKYLGVLWLFAQLPDLLKEILGSILKENEGALLNLDQEQPALRFFVGGYVFAVSVHRVQLLLQVLSVKRFHHQQQQQQQQNATNAPEELSQSEISEICDYFSRRVASEPYDASRVASFITLLTLPISVLREFLKLIAWKKVMSQAQGGDVAPAQKPRIELCLENHAGLNMDGVSVNLSGTKSNIHYDRPHNSVDFALTVVLDPAHIPHVNAAGGAAWLPYCVSVRLRYSFGENPNVSFLGMDGSHGGRACWLRVEDWEKCKQRVARSVEVHGCSPADISQGRLRLVADNVQRALHLCLQGLRDTIASLPGNS